MCRPGDGPGSFVDVLLCIYAQYIHLGGNTSHHSSSQSEEKTKKLKDLLDDMLKKGSSFNTLNELKKEYSSELSFFNLSQLSVKDLVFNNLDKCYGKVSKKELEPIKQDDFSNKEKGTPIESDSIRIDPLPGGSIKDLGTIKLIESKSSVSLPSQFTSTAPSILPSSNETYGIYKPSIFGVSVGGTTSGLQNQTSPLLEITLYDEINYKDILAIELSGGLGIRSDDYDNGSLSSKRLYAEIGILIPLFKRTGRIFVTPQYRHISHQFEFTKKSGDAQSSSIDQESLALSLGIEGPLSKDSQDQNAIERIAITPGVILKGPSNSSSYVSLTFGWSIAFGGNK